MEQTRANMTGLSKTMAVLQNVLDLSRSLELVTRTSDAKCGINLFSSPTETIIAALGRSCGLRCGCHCLLVTGDRRGHGSRSLLVHMSGRYLAKHRTSTVSHSLLLRSGR
ncbi:hypothetical protein PV04_10341 [Phialophora macrospora]|uniref:Uncharacterized protein n=1 Tax=Phialophora macrospora TaxID=1851006 RepID=A0A0D2FTZ3_9EURO|nr:hypothetical protein PV04_10341 [Phialophora macrospora]